MTRTRRTQGKRIIEHQNLRGATYQRPELLVESRSDKLARQWLIRLQHALPWCSGWQRSEVWRLIRELKAHVVLDKSETPDI